MKFIAHEGEIIHIDAYHTVSGMDCNHIRNVENAIIPLMERVSGKARQKPAPTLLWDAVAALMRARWGEENLNRLARETGLGLGTVQRIKQQETSIGIEMLDEIARCFKVPVWKLLAPDDPTDDALVREYHKLIGAYNRASPEDRQIVDIALGLENGNAS